MKLKNNKPYFLDSKKGLLDEPEYRRYGLILDLSAPGVSRTKTKGFFKASNVQETLDSIKKLNIGGKKKKNEY